ncbi:hypothetical protein EAF04_006850 [Stromatinia cepivora]|nr:hypothetical protein EAF04_006850 [Stromatinia cepivora]
MLNDKTTVAPTVVPTVLTTNKPTNTSITSTTTEMQNNNTTTNYHHLSIPQLLHLLSERKIKPSFKDALIVLLLFDDENHHDPLNENVTTAGSSHHAVDVQSAGMAQGRPEQEKQVRQARQVSPDLDVEVGGESDDLIDFEDMQHLTSDYVDHHQDSEDPRAPISKELPAPPPNDKSE